MDKEQLILAMIRDNPFITQKELSERLGLSRSAVAGYISQLMKKGKIAGRAYVLPKEGHVTCIGGANVDRKAHALEAVQVGTSNPVRVRQSLGGVARNIAENLARLGTPVSLVTFVGADSEGTWLLDETKRRGVDTSLSQVLPDCRTGTYTAVLDPHGELVLALSDMQICDSVTVEQIEARWPRIASSGMIVLDTNLPAPLLTHVIERCRRESLPLAVNPVSAVKARKLPERLDGVDILFANRDEAEALTGRSVHTLQDGHRACDRLLAKGVKRVVLTLGRDGLIWAAHDQSGLLPAKPVAVSDVTGAGDALVAGVIFGLTRGEPFSAACRLGLAAAALTLLTDQTVADLTPDRLYAMTHESETEEEPIHD